MDLERVKFLIKEYLRIRLRKIERFSLYIANNDLEASLSQPERNYLGKLLQNRAQHYENMCLLNYPKQLRYFGLKKAANS